MDIYECCVLCCIVLYIELYRVYVELIHQINLLVKKLEQSNTRVHKQNNTTHHDTTQHNSHIVFQEERLQHVKD